MPEAKPANINQPVSLALPPGLGRLLLHSCCAPCVGELMETLLHNKVDFSLLFYNPNIHPRKEYLLRKQENIRYAQRLGVEFIDIDEDGDEWFARTTGLEQEPERGRRCTVCFDMRFERSAHYAATQGYSHFTSSLGISRWKNREQINGCGLRAAARHPGLGYWTYNWRKRGGANRMIHIAKREGFYQQEYCGCVYSLRDTNRARRERGHARIRIGERHYGDTQGGAS